MSKMKSCKVCSDCKKVVRVFHGFVSVQSCVVMLLPYRNPPKEKHHAEFKILVQFCNI